MAQLEVTGPEPARQQRAAATFSLGIYLGLAELRLQALRKRSSTPLDVQPGKRSAARERNSGDDAMHVDGARHKAANGQHRQQQPPQGMLLGQQQRASGSAATAAGRSLGSGIRFAALPGSSVQSKQLAGASKSARSSKLQRWSRMASLYRSRLDPGQLPDDYLDHFIGLQAHPEVAAGAEDGNEGGSDEEGVGARRVARARRKAAAAAAAVPVGTGAVGAAEAVGPGTELAPAVIPGTAEQSLQPAAAQPVCGAEPAAVVMPSSLQHEQQQEPPIMGAAAAAAAAGPAGVAQQSLLLSAFLDDDDNTAGLSLGALGGSANDADEDDEEQDDDGDDDQDEEQGADEGGAGEEGDGDEVEDEDEVAAVDQSQGQGGAGSLMQEALADEDEGGGDDVQDDDVEMEEEVF